MIQTVWQTMWPKGNVGLLVIDNEKALVSSIEEVFPLSRHILCAWHITQHLRPNMAGCFWDKSEEIG